MSGKTEKRLREKLKIACTALERITVRAVDTSDPLHAPMGNRLQACKAIAENALTDINESRSKTG